MTKDEALDLALEIMHNQGDVGVDEWRAAEAAIKQARSAPVQEPVATDWERIARVQDAKLRAMCNDPTAFEQLCEIMDRYEALRPTPPAAQRQWVGLTDEAIWSEYQTLWPFHPAEEPRLAKDIAKFARAIEAKLKKENT